MALPTGTDLENLSVALRAGARAKAKQAGLDERYARAASLSDAANTKVDKWGQAAPLSILADVIGQSQGRRQMRDLAPQREAARADIAANENAAGLYQAKLAQEKVARDQANIENSASALVLSQQKIADAKALQNAAQNEIARNKPVTVGADTSLVTRGGDLLFQGIRRPTAPSKALGKLKEDAPSRRASISKAAKILKAFHSGAESGTSRKAAGYLPGQFTDQAAFDQELDAYAELAARARLKAMGEIRPTDTDVEGAKASLFGVGKGEQVNVNLITEYLEEQLAVENEMRVQEGLEPLPFPETEGVAGDWYGQLFKGEKPEGETPTKERTVVRRGTDSATGKRIIQYSDGSMETQ